ncbi:MAG: ABC transporter permease, partial [Anaerolineales bacterium]
MRKMILVLKQELINTFTRPSFLLFAFGIPVLSVLVLGGIKLAQGRSNQDLVVEPYTQSESQLEIEGFVDHAGLIQRIPDDMKDTLLRFDSNAQAQEALKAGKISAYYVIPADYIERGEVDYIYPDDRSYLSDGQKWVIQWT